MARSRNALLIEPHLRGVSVHVILMTFALRMVGYVLELTTFQSLYVEFSCLLSGRDQLTMGSVFLYLDSIRRLKCKDVSAISILKSVGVVRVSLGLESSNRSALYRVVPT